jgi:hypothetical protein
MQKSRMVEISLSGSGEGPVEKSTGLLDHHLFEADELAGVVAVEMRVAIQRVRGLHEIWATLVIRDEVRLAKRVARSSRDILFDKQKREERETHTAFLSVGCAHGIL